MKHCVPMDGRMVLIYAKSADPKMPFIAFGWWRKKEKRFDGIVSVWSKVITHWMPLPKAPRK